MNKSESIASLAKALSLFQGEVRDVFKERSGYNYSYADLSGVLDIVRPLLSKHGLAVVQLLGSEGDKVTVETVLMHGGEWMSSIIGMSVEGKKSMTSAQSTGSTITYMRRYALTALLGITQTDDDGNGAVNGHSQGSSTVARNESVISPTAQKDSGNDIVSDSTYSVLCSHISLGNISSETIDKWKGYFQINELSELSEGCARALINKIKRQES